MPGGPIPFDEGALSEDSPLLGPAGSVRPDWAEETEAPPSKEHSPEPGEAAAVGPEGPTTTPETEQAGPKLKGVFGGAGGRYLLLEHPRGVAGQMPGCHVTDVVVRLWNALEAGDLPEAKRVYGLIAPLFAIEMQCRGAIYKEVLRRRGVIRSARSRNAPPGLMDEQDHRALDDILRDLEPLFTWQGPGAIPYGEAHPEPRDTPRRASTAEFAASEGGAAPFDR